MIPFDAKVFPLWFTDLDDFDLSTTVYSPIETAAAHDIGQYSRSGFGVKNATETAGLIRVVTLAQYRANHESLTGIVPRTVRLNGGDWCLTPVVKVFAANDATYASTGTTYITIGKIIA